MTGTDDETWASDLAESATQFREQCQARAAESESLRRVDRKVASTAARRRADLLCRLASHAGEDLTALQAEHEKGVELRRRERTRAVEALWSQVSDIDTLKRPMQATIGRLRTTQQTAGALMLTAAPASPTLSCMVKIRGSYDEAVVDSGSDTSHQSNFLEDRRRIRAVVEAGASSTIQYDFGWIFGWECLRPGYAKVGSSHVLAGVLEAACGESCWPVTPFGAVAQVALSITLEVRRFGQPIYPPGFLAPQRKKIDAISTSEGQSSVRLVKGTFDHTHPGIPVLEGDRVIARIGLDLLASGLGDSEAKADFRNNKDAGDELLCAWMIVDSQPG